MPLVHDGDRVTKDADGLEMDGIETVRKETIKAICGFAHDMKPDGDLRSIVVGVRDGEGNPVLRAVLSLMVERQG